MRQLVTDALIVTGDAATEPYSGDALIDGERIVHLGEVPPSAAAGADRTIDAGGRVLAPGFVDTHNHGALAGIRLGEHGIPVSCEMAVRAGVTKRICGVDGLSPAPVAPNQRAEYAAQLTPLTARWERRAIPKATIPPGAFIGRGRRWKSSWPGTAAAPSPTWACIWATAR